MPRLPADVARALVACVRPPAPSSESLAAPSGSPGPLASLSSLSSLDPLVTAAAAHGVSGFAWRAVRAAGLGDRPEAAPLRAAAAVAAGRHLRALAEVERIDAALSEVAWLLFKGPVLALVHGSPTLRSPVDLDLLVPRASFGVAVAALERAGYVVYERNWTLVRRARLGSLRLHSPAGALVDLHWDLLNTRTEREAFTVSSAAALERARPVPVGSVQVRTLDPVDTVVHLALHAALAGAHRLVWLADVAAAARALTTPTTSPRALTSAGVPGEALAAGMVGATGVTDAAAVVGTAGVGGTTGAAEVAARAAEWSVGPPVALVLRRCAAVLGQDALVAPGAGIPVGVGWRAVCRMVDALAPVSRWAGGPSPAAAVARSARADGPAGLRELTRHALAAVRTGGARPDPQSLFDPADPTSVAHPAGGVAERGAYLAEVTA